MAPWPLHSLASSTHPKHSPWHCRTSVQTSRAHGSFHPQCPGVSRAHIQQQMSHLLQMCLSVVSTERTSVSPCHLQGTLAGCSLPTAADLIPRRCTWVPKKGETNRHYGLVRISKWGAVQTGLSLPHKHVVDVGQGHFTHWAAWKAPPHHLRMCCLLDTQEKGTHGGSISLWQRIWRHCSWVATYTDTLWGLRFCRRQPARAGRCTVGRSAGSGARPCCACTCIPHAPRRGKRARITHSKGQSLQGTSNGHKQEIACQLHAIALSRRRDIAWCPVQPRVNIL